MSSEEMRYALLRAGPDLRDYAAASTCPCSCHPQVSALHSGGQECRCQLTKDEQAAQLERFFAVIAEINSRDPDFMSRAEESTQFQEEAAELGVSDAQIRALGCPLVVSGKIDGRSFFLRERHGIYRVECAPEHAPEVDLWSSDMDGVIVKEGVEGDLIEQGDPPAVRALKVAACAVRSYLRAYSCEHRMIPTGALFCPWCGKEL